jgi:hypothetical protein
MQTKSIDTPLSEITLRRYEKPYNLTKRELVRKLCLSLGLLNPGDSRDVIVDVFYVLLDARKENRKVSSEEIRDDVLAFRKSSKLDDNGTAGSNIRRQIRRLRVEKFMIPSIIERLKEYLIAVDENFKRKDDKL